MKNKKENRNYLYSHQQFTIYKYPEGKKNTIFIYASGYAVYIDTYIHRTNSTRFKNEHLYIDSFYSQRNLAIRTTFYSILSISSGYYKLFVKTFFNGCILFCQVDHHVVTIYYLLLSIQVASTFSLT